MPWLAMPLCACVSLQGRTGPMDTYEPHVCFSLPADKAVYQDKTNMLFSVSAARTWYDTLLTARISLPAQNLSKMPCGTPKLRWLALKYRVRW